MTVRGVALILFNSKGEIYAVQELLPNLSVGKIPGVKDFSFPLETQEEGEDDFDTLRRLIYEEIDETWAVRMTQPQCIGEFQVNVAYANAYVARLTSDESAVYRGSHHGVEIHALGWTKINTGKSLEEFLFRARDGVREILAVACCRYGALVEERTSVDIN